LEVRIPRNVMYAETRQIAYALRIARAGTRESGSGFAMLI